MAALRDSYIDLDRHRQLLEENLEKLQTSLRQWQLWEAEYDALKEEITSLPPPVSQKDIARIRRDFDGQVVNRKEVNEIFGRVDLKPADQIINVLSRRLDYVATNVKTLEKQVDAAEKKLDAATVVSQDVRHEDGESITDIIEQLDEDDNVMSFRLHTPSNTQPQVLETLEKAGVTDLPAVNQPLEADGSEHHLEDKPVEQPVSKQSPQPNEGPPLKSSVKKIPSKKGVSFAEDTKAGHEAQPSPASRYLAAQRRERVIQAAKNQETSFLPPSALPENESPEDAELRRQMLEYSMSDIGPVVAELEIDDEYSDEEYTDSEDTDVDEEDGHGRSKYSVIGDDYRKRMMDLEAKLHAQPYFTTNTKESASDGNGQLSLGTSQSLTAPENGKAVEVERERKGVAFADNLDIAPADNYILDSRPDPSTQTEPHGDVVERTNSNPTKTTEKPTKKSSRFKRDRDDNVAAAGSQSGATNTGQLPKGPHEAPLRFLNHVKQTAPSGPDGQTIANAVVEREAVSEAREPDEFDATLLHQEAAVEYHRLRNRIIQKQGGFLQENEPAVERLDEVEDGPKRVSRFKAARFSQN